MSCRWAVLKIGLRYASEVLEKVLESVPVLADGLD
jgi:hypothetical protein